MPRQKITVPEEIELLSEEYFDECTENGEPLTFAGLAHALGFARTESLRDYCTKDTLKEFHDAMNRACLRVEAYMEKRLYDKNCNIAGPIFALKARAGLRDKDDGGKGQEVHVHLEGLAAKF